MDTVSVLAACLEGAQKYDHVVDEMCAPASVIKQPEKYGMLMRCYRLTSSDALGRKSWFDPGNMMLQPYDRLGPWRLLTRQEFETLARYAAGEGIAWSSHIRDLAGAPMIDESRMAKPEGQLVVRDGDRLLTYLHWCCTARRTPLVPLETQMSDHMSVAHMREILSALPGWWTFNQYSDPEGNSCLPTKRTEVLSKSSKVEIWPTSR